MNPADVSASAARRFLASLDDAQRAAASAPFDVADHRRWTYLPGVRPGLALAEMNAEQQALALRLLDAGGSEGGARTARAVVELDMIRRQLAAEPGHEPDPADHRFWVRILGDPAGDAPWAWRMNGHHLAVHVTVVDGSIAVTPHFFGAEPAVVLHGPHRGVRTLPDEEDLARALLATCDPAQRRLAVASPLAPSDILTRHDPVADPEVVPTGLPYGGMSPEQRELMQRVILLYFNRAPADVAASAWRTVLDAGIDGVTFGWSGSDVRGQGHYYAVRGPTFLLEYDNTQDDANHIHSVWRDLRNDWGDDLLAAHYASHEH
ncbi:MAG TPA: DUF3500 domain-containing protein [Jiangellaceae bacterium]|nr:DUF3500 domain-containing protein [Jiangellaceae bacterium]